MLTSPSQQLFHPDSFTLTPQTFPSFPPQLCVLCCVVLCPQTQTSPFPLQLLPHYDSSSPSGTVPTSAQAWDAGDGHREAATLRSLLEKFPTVPARRRSRCRVVPHQRHLLPDAAALSKIRPPAVFCPPAGRTADCGDQPGFGEFLVPPPPLFVGRTIFCAECGPRCTMYAPAAPPHGSRLLCCTTHTCTAKTAGVTKSSRRHNTRKNRLDSLVKR